MINLDIPKLRASLIIINVFLVLFVSFQCCDNTGVYPGFTQIEWYNHLYPLLDDAHKPMECVQEAGEILYLVNLKIILYTILSTVFVCFRR